jgi:hypothetical protein
MQMLVIDLVALAARAMTVCGAACAVSEVQLELLIAAKQQQPEQPQHGVGQVSLVAHASSRRSLGLSSFLQVKDELILLFLIIGRVMGQVLVRGSTQQHAWSAGLARAVLDKLVELSSRFKYIVHVVLVENKGSAQLMNGCYSKAAAVDHFRHRRRTPVLHGGVAVFCSRTLPRQ